MKEHKKVHMRDRSVNEAETAATKLYYYCDICGKKSTTATGLSVHKREIHNPVPVPCNICGVIFQNTSKMKCHYNTEHKPKQCEHCDYKTGKSNHLKKHMAKHFDPKFKCSYCEKMLKRRVKSH